MLSRDEFLINVDLMVCGVTVEEQSKGERSILDNDAEQRAEIAILKRRLADLISAHDADRAIGEQQCDDMQAEITRLTKEKDKLMSEAVQFAEDVKLFAPNAVVAYKQADRFLNRPEVQAWRKRQKEEGP